MKYIIIYLVTAALMTAQTQANVKGHIIKGILVAMGVGTAAAADSEIELARDAYSDRENELTNLGISPTMGAQFDVRLQLNSNSDDVYWADTIGNPDIFFVIEGAGQQRITIPEVHDGYGGGSVSHSIYGLKSPKNGSFKLHIYDDDGDLNEVINRFIPTGVNLGIQTVAVGASLQLKFPNSQTHLVKPDYIGTLEFLTPKESSTWKASGVINDRWGRNIGSFDIRQIPILSDAEVAKYNSGSVFWSFVKWGAIGFLLYWIVTRFTQKKAT